MPTVTYNNESFTCTTVLKGEDYIHLLDASGNMITAFDGVVDFSGFSITDGDWTSPTAVDFCSIAVIEDDGTIGKSSFKPSDIAKAGDITPASIGAVALEDTGKARPYQTSAAVFTISESTSLKEVHYGKFLWASSSNDIVITIPKNETTAIPSSMEFEFCKGSTGKVTFSPASGVTLFSVDNARTIAERYSCVVLKKINTDIWLLAGDLA